MVVSKSNEKLIIYLFALVAAFLMPVVIGAPTGTTSADDSTIIKGSISVVEADGTVAIGSESGQAVVVYVREDTQIFRDGKPAGLKDLKKGDKVTARYTPDRSLIEIQAARGNGASKSSAIEGTITLKEVDGTLVILSSSDKSAVVVYANEDSKIFLNGNRADFEHLDKGDWVRADVGPDRHLSELRAFTYDPHKPGNITVIKGTVSAKMMSGTVSIAEKGKAVVVHLTDDSRVTRNGAPATLKDIRKGDRVQAKYGPDRGVLELRILNS